MSGLCSKQSREDSVAADRICADISANADISAVTSPLGASPRDSQLLHSRLKCRALHPQPIRCSPWAREPPFRGAQRLEDVFPFDLFEGGGAYRCGVCHALEFCQG